MSPNILVGDPCPIFLDGVACACVEIGVEARLVDDAGSVEESFRSYEPDIVLFNPMIWARNGWQKLASVRQRQRLRTVGVLTDQTSRWHGVHLRRVHPNAYIDKRYLTAEMLDCVIRSLLAGGQVFLCGEELVFDQPELHQRELEVLRLMSTGMTVRQIAEALFLAERTVKVDIRRVITKLETANRAEAVMQAYRRGILTPTDARVLA
ncbi:helix-turn-helix transcriptional regulator [Tenggerimyces flavus]|uniref:LuxR C-terminal-related transcriptional regulator n=1 Tax=Tenggerimyces flavus TaxID=1708749 RepID=A0ABV7YK06_9ACTN|nr:response regulator transcription factor [Tenggerimyces flavus]MBM7789593.1 DNA-binding NarL/FixJ family response regulator [Tenggerimyces flavus]